MTQVDTAQGFLAFPSHVTYLQEGGCEAEYRAHEILSPNGSGSIHQADSCYNLEHYYSQWLIITLLLGGTTRTSRLDFIVVLRLPLIFLSLPG